MSISLMVSFWASSPLSFALTVLFYRYLYFVVNQIKLQSYKVYQKMVNNRKFTYIIKARD